MTSIAPHTNWRVLHRDVEVIYAIKHMYKSSTTIVGAAHQTQHPPGRRILPFHWWMRWWGTSHPLPLTPPNWWPQAWSSSRGCWLVLWLTARELEEVMMTSRWRRFAKAALTSMLGVTSLGVWPVVWGFGAIIEHFFRVVPNILTVKNSCLFLYLKVLSRPWVWDPRQCELSGIGCSQMAGVGNYWGLARRCEQYFI